MTSVFSRPTRFAAISVAVVSLVVTIVLTVIGNDPSSQRSAGADAYSRSAIGHRGFVDLLRHLDVPVVVSRHASLDRPKRGLLVIAEPRVDTSDRGTAKLRAEIEAAHRVLIVLPKWYGFARPGAPWIDRAALLPASDVEAIANVLGGEKSFAIARDTVAVRWSERAGVAPVIAQPQSLVRTEALEPVVVSGDRVLLARTEVADHEVWILSDPDVIDNAGLREPANARFAVELVDELRDGGTVVFDETVHGHSESPSLFRTLFQFPLVLATLQVILCGLLAVWAAMVRFGPRRSPPPPLAPGKDFLIRNTAALLAYGGHHGDALRRYLAASVQTVRHALHAPDGLARPALVAWLERVRLVRAGTISLPDLERAVESAAKASPQTILELADQVYRWRMEMMHGSHHRS